MPRGVGVRVPLSAQVADLLHQKEVDYLFSQPLFIFIPYTITAIETALRGQRRGTPRRAGEIIVVYQLLENKLSVLIHHHYFICSPANYLFSGLAILSLIEVSAMTFFIL